MSKYSLIFTVFNEGNNIEYFLDSLVNQSHLPDEIVVIDGGSTDNTVEVMNNVLEAKFNGDFSIIVDETCSKKYCIGPIARGRNRAIDLSKYENIVVTDAGCILDKDWFVNIVRGFESGADVVSGNYKANAKNRFQCYIADIFCKDISELEIKDNKSFEPSSRSFGFKKNIWRSVGGYPENSYTAEDTKFVRNIFEITDNIYVAKDAIVYWDVPNSFKELKSKLISYGIGDGMQRLDKLKYFLRFVALLLLPVTVPVLLMRKKKLITIPMYFFQVYGYLRGLFNA
ncbi:glycosyltransferase [Vibrio metschnikovii]|nr:glycosyltransferase [Vibrio metschnikovii]